MTDEKLDEVDPREMHNALRAITNEIQRFHEKSDSTNESNNAETLNKVINYKFAINVRDLRIKHLKSSLKTACAVVKTVSLAKASEIASLNEHLNDARNQYFDLEQQQNEKNQLINSLHKENRALRDQLEFFKNAIELGYQQLQGIRNERIENISILEKLKNIIIRCGQYHAGQYNEHERCVRLQQKNSFLYSKMMIMENNLAAARDEVQNLRNCIKPYQEKRESSTKSRKSIDVVCSEYKLGSHQRNFTKLTMTKFELTRCSSLTNVRQLDLKSHVKKVKNLLSDHDILLKDLKSLSRVINFSKT